MKKGLPFREPYLYAQRNKITECHYCRMSFNLRRPPTFDHVIPKAHGGTLDDGLVLACQECNNARQSCPYEIYKQVVDWEWMLSEIEQRPWRRPKARQTPEGWAITTLPKGVWREVSMREAV